MFSQRTSVLAFSPQTTLKDNEILNENKWMLNRLEELTLKENGLVDLNDVLSQQSDCSVYCVCCEGREFDILNIQHIRKHLSAAYKVTNSSEHNSALVLKQLGILEHFVSSYKRFPNTENLIRFI